MWAVMDIEVYLIDLIVLFGSFGLKIYGVFMDFTGGKSFNEIEKSFFF